MGALAFEVSGEFAASGSNCPLPEQRRAGKEAVLPSLKLNLDSLKTQRGLGDCCCPFRRSGSDSSSPWSGVEGAGLAVGQAEPTDRKRDAARFCWGCLLCGPPSAHHLAEAREVCRGQLAGCCNPAVAPRSSCAARCVSEERSWGLAWGFWPNCLSSSDHKSCSAGLRGAMSNIWLISGLRRVPSPLLLSD